MASCCCSASRPGDPARCRGPRRAGDDLPTGVVVGADAVIVLGLGNGARPRGGWIDDRGARPTVVTSDHHEVLGRRHRRLVALGSLAACGSDDDGAGTVAPVTSGTSSSADSTVPGSLAPGGSDVERAIADAARRSGADPGDVEVVSDEEVTWRDSTPGARRRGCSTCRSSPTALGSCWPSMTTFEYHSGGDRDMFFCADPQPPV